MRLPPFFSRPARARRKSQIRRRPALETLEQRALLTATLIRLGAPVATFATIQTAINSARENDTIEVSDGTYAESLNLSNMGSSVGQGPGNLIIRGTGATSAAVTVNSPGGPALFNSSAFSGNLTIQNVTLQSPTSTLADDTGLDLNNYAGRLRFENSRIQTTAGSAIDITNSSGNFSFSELSINNVGNTSTHHALNLQNVSATVVVLDCDMLNVAGSGIVVDNAASTQLSLVVHGGEIFGDAGFLSTNDAVRVQASGSARVDASITDNDLFDLDGSALRFDVSGSAQAQVYGGNNRINNADQETAIVVNTSNNAIGAFAFQDMDIASTKGGGFALSGRDSSSLNVFLDNNFLNDIGDAAGEDAIKLTSNAGSTATINAYFGFNAVVTSAGAGLRVEGVGGAVYSVTAYDNFFVDLSTATSPAVLLFEKAGANNTANFRFDLARNIATDLNVASYVLTQAGTGTFQLEGDQASAMQQLETTNTGETFTINGALALAAPGAFDNSTPGILGGFVWEDDNANGIQDAAEAAYVGLAATLSGTSSGGAAVSRTTISAGDGTYRFSAVLPGAYSVQIENPNGFTLAPPNQGADDDLDSEFSRQDLVINPLPVTLAPGDSNDVNDAGMMPNYQNPDNPLDTNGDFFIAPDDALGLINSLIVDGARQLFFPAPLPRAPIYLDVDGDDFIAPNDVLFIINFLILENAAPPDGEAEGEPLRSVEPPSTATGILEVDLSEPLQQWFTAGNTRQVPTVESSQRSQVADDQQQASQNGNGSPPAARAVDLALADFPTRRLVDADALDDPLPPLDGALPAAASADAALADWTFAL